MRKVKNNIEEWWKTKEIMEKLEKIHKDFYPVPITNDILETIQDKISVTRLNQATVEPYLTEEDLRELYSVASSWIHAQNPLKVTQYELTEEQFKEQLSSINDDAEKMSNLLSFHKLQPLNSSGFFVASIRQIDEPISPNKIQVHTAVTVEYCP